MSTWAKVELDDKLNQVVEQHKNLNDCSKPDAINLMLRAYAREHYETWPDEGRFADE